MAADRVYAYLERDNERESGNGPLFRPIRGTTTGAGISANGIYKVVALRARVAGI